MSAFDQIISFAESGTYQPNDLVFRALTRNEISQRLLSWSKLIQKQNYSEETSYLVTSIIGEIANNSFDHNLGKWKDAVGCLISFDFLPDRLRIGLIDRGQGIVQSLKVVRPHVDNPADYLVMAFEEMISGRAPEQRGNGLKYVRKNFLNEDGFELICLSNGYCYKIGPQSFLDELLKSSQNFQGTLIAFDWNKKGFES